jgi:hypothetical protein
MDEKKKKLTDKEKREMAKEEKDADIWSTEEEEGMERAPADLLKKEDPELLKKEYGDVKVNPPGSGGENIKKKF